MFPDTDDFEYDPVVRFWRSDVDVKKLFLAHGSTVRAPTHGLLTWVASWMKSGRSVRLLRCGGRFVLRILNSEGAG